jgi:SAM-dependent methyltransferase
VAVLTAPAPVRGGAGFDPALESSWAHVLRSDGAVVDLAVGRWRDAAAAEDCWLLDRCTGTTIDLGCGPGRLVAALAGRGVPALGVDTSAAAQRQCWARGAPVLRRDLFDRLPAEGCWDHVLLADGNIGIGGDPARLLARTARLLAPGGSVLVETDPRPDLSWTGTARIRTAAGTGPPLRWACVGSDALVELAGPVGLVRAAAHAGPRSFVELRLAAGHARGRRAERRPA